jgi:hypothetical protein
MMPTSYWLGADCGRVTGKPFLDLLRGSPVRDSWRPESAHFLFQGVEPP